MRMAPNSFLMNWVGRWDSEPYLVQKCSLLEHPVLQVTPNGWAAAIRSQITDGLSAYKVVDEAS